MNWPHKDLIGIADLTRNEIETILDMTPSFKEISQRDIKKVPTLRGKTVVLLFYEASTRTRLSFEIAAKRLSADTVALSKTGTSFEKGETMMDVAQNVMAMAPDCIVIRYPFAGMVRRLASTLPCSIINAGDGFHEHPTQALLDMLTIREKKGTIEGLTVAIVGDIAHSRVARSNIYGLITMGASVRVCGPALMMPRDIGRMGVDVHYDMEEAIRGVDVIMMLRIQFERHHNSRYPSTREYARGYCLNEAKITGAKKDVMVMHPGPINRGIEISPEVADGPYSVILDQVANGVAVRMALLYLLLPGEQL